MEKISIKSVSECIILEENSMLCENNLESFKERKGKLEIFRKAMKQTRNNVNKKNSALLE